MTVGSARIKVRSCDLVLCMFLFFCHALFLRNHQVAARAVAEGLRLCATSVIPSLFPFFVLSSMLVEGNAEKILFAPLSRRFGWNPSAGCAVLLALLCGAPVGAGVLSAALDKGKLSKEEAESLLPLVGSPSLSFLLGTVGGTFFGSMQKGALLFLSTLPGLFLCLFLFYRRNCRDIILNLDAPPLRLSKLFTDGVASAAKNSLLVSAYVVFFASLFEALSYLFAAFSPSRALSSLFYCTLELSGGLQRVATLPLSLSLPLAGFAAGFSGISIFFQVLSLVDGRGLRVRKYILGRLIIGATAAILFPLFCRLFAR